MLRTLWNDDFGAIISAELVLVLTITVLSMMVGLHELASGVIHELADVSESIGHLDQSYVLSGFASEKSDTQGATQYKSAYGGSNFADAQDNCDDCSGSQDLTDCDGIFDGECDS